MQVSVPAKPCRRMALQWDCLASSQGTLKSTGEARRVSDHDGLETSCSSSRRLPKTLCWRHRLWIVDNDRYCSALTALGFKVKKHMKCGKTSKCASFKQPLQLQEQDWSTQKRILALSFVCHIIICCCKVELFSRLSCYPSIWHTLIHAEVAISTFYLSVPRKLINFDPSFPAKRGFYWKHQSLWKYVELFWGKAWRTFSLCVHFMQHTQRSRAIFTFDHVCASRFSTLIMSDAGDVSISKVRRLLPCVVFILNSVQVWTSLGSAHCPANQRLCLHV